ncbi:MAG: ATP-dependent helicase [Anaerolineae bacterium]
MNSPDYVLNASQEMAVNWTEGPLLVLAGPGSGKTLVLTLRAARLLQADPEASVLALTFTTKAAAEMRERLDRLMGGRTERAHLCTFHSFAADILRQHGGHVGIRPDFSLTPTLRDRLALLEQAISQIQGDTSTLPSDRESLLVLLDRLFSESYSGEPQASGLTYTPTWLPELFARYCDAQLTNNRLDFGGLLHFARLLLSRNASVARLTRLAWQYVCVDEFQDTNRAQYDLLRLLITENCPNLFVVADDDQTIYQWNGASPERIRLLKDEIGMAVVQLPQSYRCSAAIIQLANNLIKHNEGRFSGKTSLVSLRPQPDSPVVKLQAFADEIEEAAMIPAAIKKNGWKATDCAILARARRLLRQVGQELKSRGLNPYIAQRKNEFESASVHWMYSALRLANARHDRELLRRISLAWQAFTNSSTEADDIEASAVMYGGDFLRAWVASASTKVDEDSLHGALLSRVSHDLVDRLSFMELLEWFWEQSWLADEVEGEEIETWKALHRDILREHSPRDISLHLYLQEMDMKSKAPARPPDSVACLTIHGAKGLEFRHVFLIGMADEVFPSYQAVKKGPDSREMEEERRSCFVAITRAQETLHISWAHRYGAYHRRPSRFIHEMGLELPTSQDPPHEDQESIAQSDLGQAPG